VSVPPHSLRKAGTTAEVIGATAAEEFSYHSSFNLLIYPPQERLVRFVLTTAADQPRSINLDTETLRLHLRDAESAERRELALLFGERAAGVVSVRELWLDEGEREAILTLIADRADLEAELRLEALFTHLLVESPSRFDGYLRIYSESEGVPDFARSGQRLVP
jgi:hypothetical protein